MSSDYCKAAAGTFKLNKDKSIHRWYPYLEGYSSSLIDDIINEINPQNITAIYDPFCGSGTTALVASKYGITSYYSETNPFMRTVIEAKVNCVKRLRECGAGSAYLRDLLLSISRYKYKSHSSDAKWNGFEKYFDSDVLYKIQDMQRKIHKINDDDTKKIALVILASVIVRASKMKRQGDLRYAKPDEKSDGDKDVISNFKEKIIQAIADIEDDGCPVLAGTTCISEDARDIDAEDLVDCVITSPPYLNGTNYIRNTKLELKLFDYIESEDDLPKYHSKGIMAGINNVSKRKSEIEVLQCIDSYVQKLKQVAYDKRIPTMVAGYFYDMKEFIKSLARAVKDSGFLIMDIGDSQFAGIYIPTHEILIDICKEYGFELYDENILRKRRSRNGMDLSQRLLKFRLHKKKDTHTSFFKKAECFLNEMPYKKSPYSGRNWGHPWHSLCSYHGKLKPAIAHFMIEQFTEIGDVVLDPLCGVGTIPFEACIQGRIGIGNDLSPMAYVVTKAKLEKPSYEDCQKTLDELSKFIESNIHLKFISDDVTKYKTFGYNGTVDSYFHQDTFKEIICARKYFLSKLSNLTSAEAMVFTCFLHILHGNRPYALSRNSHPLTPYSPSGKFEYKNVVDHISSKLMLSFSKGIFDTYTNGRAKLGDFNELCCANISADAIICSPPFAGSMRFYMQNWMRLWLCGWEEVDFKQAETTFLDQKQIKDFNVYIPFFEMCSSVLKPNGKIILHLGKTEKVDMAEELSKRAMTWFTEVYRGHEDVSSIEKHGVKDKGATILHEFLFLQKNNGCGL